MEVTLSELGEPAEYKGIAYGRIEISGRSVERDESEAD